METINYRIKSLRKEIGYNQRSFAKAMGVGQTSISFLEKDGSTVTEQNIKTISNLFNVSEEWLRTGNGVKFLESNNSTLLQVSELLKLDDIEQKFLAAYLNMEYEDRKNFKTAISNFVKSYNILDTEIAATVAARPAKPDHNLAVAAKRAIVNAELDNEEKAATSSVSTSINGLDGEKMA